MFCCNPLKGRRQRKEWGDSWKVKVVVVGDGRSGKTCLIQRYCCGTLPPTYTPTLFDTTTTTSLVEGRKVQLVIQDTAGQEDLDQLRPPCYLHSDVVIICFPADCEDSWERVGRVWVPEARRYCGKHVPLVLVANKTDLAHSRPGNTTTLNMNDTTQGIDLVHPSRNGLPSENPSFQLSEEGSFQSETVFRNSRLSRLQEDVGDKRRSADSGFFGSTENLVPCGVEEEKRSLLRQSRSKADRTKHTSTDQCVGQYGSTEQRGRSLATQVGAVGYFETSAVLDQGIEQAFQSALAAAMASKQWKKKYRL
ncbi:uncharacterized protein LOC143297926 [Babylonia areolata]|uniref:uncharacterized protein LOC143297860 n=1 Tax=Babylonia areolata TaxID=304850 RepID=UPI003FD673E1